MGVLNFITRPLLGLQTTTNKVFQRYNTLQVSDPTVTGNIYFRTVGALCPMGITPGPSHKLNNVNVTGNTAYGVVVQPLTDDKLKVV